jgi:hypothetical protein
LIVVRLIGESLSIQEASIISVRGDIDLLGKLICGSADIYL